MPYARVRAHAMAGCVLAVAGAGYPGGISMPALHQRRKPGGTRKTAQRRPAGVRWQGNPSAYKDSHKYTLNQINRDIYNY